MNQKTGTFVISLDFELMWGIRDLATNEGYGASNIAPVHEVLPKIVALFEKYNVKATIATVGFLMHKNKEDLLHNLPQHHPTYNNPDLSPYTDDYIYRIDPKYNSQYFAPELVELLKSSKNIEIGTHTYCHYYCTDSGQTIEQFDDDLQMACLIAKDKGIELSSIVFPRNEINPGYLEICLKNGIKAYRGNAKKFYKSKKTKFGYILQRIARLADTYIPIGGSSTWKYEEITSPAHGIANVPASRFLRPYSRSLRFLEPLKVSRIKKEILHAAKANQLYHLWWHPHNFGTFTDKNLEQLESILQFFANCNLKYGIKSASMNEYINSI